jgi:hypothetical protein
MQIQRFTVLCLLACLVVAVPLLAQEGHPLKGSWLGDYGPGATGRTQVFMVMDWDGKNITGTINPGTDNTPIHNATLTPDNKEGWSVHFEADGKDSAGRAVHIVVDGKIQNLGLSNRSVIGTWTAGTTKYDFKIARQ